MTSPRNPSWADNSGQAILIEVEVDGVWTPYVCRADDLVEFSREAFAAAQQGQFGPIAPFVPD